MTQQERIDTLIARMREVAADHGTSVRCPECGAGAGKFCRVAMRDTPEAEYRAIVLHPKRIDAATAQTVARYETKEV